MIIYIYIYCICAGFQAGTTSSCEGTGSALEWPGPVKTARSTAKLGCKEGNKATKITTVFVPFKKS